MSVLIVEDYRNLGRYFQLALAALKIESRNVASAEAALVVARFDRPQLILADLGLPGESGLVMARYFKDEPDLAAIPIIAVTAFDEQWDPKEVREAGCEELLIKPVLTEQLLEVVRKYLPASAKR